MKWLTPKLIALALVGALALVTGCEMKSADTNTQPQISVQLWSVREEVKSDIEGALRQIAAMGFDGVEFAGEFGSYADNPQGLKQLLDQLGLKVSGAHVGFQQFDAEHFEHTLAFARALECSTLIIPWDERAFDPERIEAFVKDLTALAAKLEPEGFRVGYHNHHQEFGSFLDATFWDYIARETPASIVLQQDVGWTTYAGKDPVDYVRRYPGRTVTTHYKATLPEGTQGRQPIIGRDTIDWLSLIQANIEVGGTLWVVVEQEDYPEGMTPMEAVKASKAGLDEVLRRL